MSSGRITEFIHFSAVLFLCLSIWCHFILPLHIRWKHFTFHFTFWQLWLFCRWFPHTKHKYIYQTFTLLYIYSLNCKYENWVKDLLVRNISSITLSNLVSLLHCSPSDMHYCSNLGYNIQYFVLLWHLLFTVFSGVKKPTFPDDESIASSLRPLFKVKATISSSYYSNPEEANRWVSVCLLTVIERLWVQSFCVLLTWCFSWGIMRAGEEIPSSPAAFRCCWKYSDHN